MKATWVEISDLAKKFRSARAPGPERFAYAHVSSAPEHSRIFPERSGTEIIWSYGRTKNSLNIQNNNYLDISNII